MLLRADNISKHFKGVTAIRQLDFELEEGLICRRHWSQRRRQDDVFQCFNGDAEPR